MKTINLLTLFFFSMITIFSSFGQVEFEWGQSFGTQLGFEGTQAIVRDSADDIIMIGMFRDSIDLDTSDFQGSGYLVNDVHHVAAFISKYNPDGTLKWAKQFKGDQGQLVNLLLPAPADSNFLQVNSVSVDKSGNIYISGEFSGLVDFDPSESSTYHLTNPMPSIHFVAPTVGPAFWFHTKDAFMVKLGPDGSFKWVKQLGGQSFPLDQSSRNNTAECIKVDKNDNIYVLGSIVGDGAAFIPSNNGSPVPLGDIGSQGPGQPNTAMYILKLTADGDYMSSEKILHVVPATGDFYMTANNRLAIDPFGDVLICGNTIYTGQNTVDFDPGPETKLQTPINDPFAGGTTLLSKYSFVLKLNSNLQYVWVAINKGAAVNYTNGVVTDYKGNVYYHLKVEGSTNSSNDAPNDFDANPDPTATFYIPGVPAFYGTNVLIKLDKAMNFIYAKEISNNADLVRISDIAVNSKEDVYLVGAFNYTQAYQDQGRFIDFDPDPTTQFLGQPIKTGSASYRFFFLKWDANGAFKWAKDFGAVGTSLCLPQIAINKSECNIYMAGAFNSHQPVSDFDPNPTKQAFLTSKGEPDIFFLRFLDYLDTKPTITASGPLSFCPGDSVTLTATENLPNYQWYPTNETSQLIQAKNAGKYAVSTMYQCQTLTSDTVTVALFPVPQITVLNETTIKLGEQIDLTTLVLNGDTYLWTPDSALSCNDCLSPIATPDKTTNYCVKVTSSDNCSADKCVKINVTPICSEVFLPNAFSPNEDGNNDLLEIKSKGDCITDFNLQIYDRWGEKVFEGTKLTDTWDGTFNGKKLDNAVFFYQMKYTITETNKNFSQKGNISIIK